MDKMEMRSNAEECRKAVIKNLKETYCRLRPSEISGVGVFAVRNIPRGVNPFLVLRKEAWFKLSKSELDGIGSEIMKLVDDFFVIEKDGSAWISDFCLNGLNISYFVNHSKAPNLKRMPSGEFKALREIHSGEELTVDYSTYDGKYG
jgi:hypothetical protein